MKTRELSQNWTVRPRAPRSTYERTQTYYLPEIPATVPGHVHLDLVAQGIIADPFRERFEAGCTWVDETAWVYACGFNWRSDPALPRRTLVFEGLDTVAKVFLNGALIGASDNFHVPLELDVTDMLEAGKNLLEVEFESAVVEGDRRRTEYLRANGQSLEVKLFDERAFIRKPGYMSGWDWGPRLVSCGIWKPVRLIEFVGRLKNCSVIQTPQPGGFLLTADCEIEGEGDLRLTYAGVPLAEADGSIEARGERWWPNGYGPQVLRPFEFKLSTGHTVVRNVGLRTVELRREPDKHGTSFDFIVNGQRVWCRGANWIPNDSFPSRILASQIQGSVERAAKLGMNMLRVWGGGLYESDAFYEACDRAGILVWQDFPYACSYYPDDDAHRREAVREAAHHVTRLRDHACLALWCGNNENRSMWFGKWMGEGTAPTRFFGEPIYEETLPGVVAALDPARPYIPSSPLLVSNMSDAPSDPPSHSDDHFWDAWHGRGDWSHYRDSTARFSSEFGFASSCSMHAWKAVTLREVDQEDPTVRWHDKTNKGWEKFKGYVELHYPGAKTLEDWVFYSQLNQRDAMRCAVEHYRSGDRCSGALIWQWNDCWPVQSWALEDYARLLKPAGFELLRLYAHVLITPVLTGDRVHAVISNDSQSSIEATFFVEVVDVAKGEVSERREWLVAVKSGERLAADGFSTGALNPKTTAIRFGLIDHPLHDRWLILCEPKDLDVQPNPIEVIVHGNELEIQTRGYVHDLEFWDEADPTNLRDPRTGLAGFRACTGLDLKLRVAFRSPAISLRARSLAGCHPCMSEEVGK